MQVQNALFLCTGNSARSILAEAIKAHWSLPDPAAVDRPGQLEAFQATYRELADRIARFLATEAVNG